MRALILATALLASSPALAGQPVSLRADVSAAGAVTLGDLFDNTGRAADVVVGPAAQPGLNVILDAGQVQRLARSAGLDWDNRGNLRRIIVRGEASGTISRTPAKVEALTYTRNINTGEIVRAEDLTWSEVAGFAAAPDAPRDAEDAIGKAARKPLRAGAAVAARDLAMPQVIKRDDMVQVSFRSGGVSLTLQGKALEAAAIGSPFSVQNVASKKIIEAVAIGPGRAVVGPEADRLRASSHPAPLALR